MKPYRPLDRTHRLLDKHPGQYIVPILPVPVIRPTKNAAGMQFTNGRRGRMRNLSDTALMLIVRGTLDPSARGLQYKVVQGTCPCCNQKTGKLVLTDRGRLRLRVMRNRMKQKKETQDATG